MQIREPNLESGCFYHIFNRGINSQRIFLADEHCNFFLQKARIYLFPFFEVYAYCLMNTHFHLLLRSKELEAESDKIPNIRKAEKGLHSERNIYSKQIGKLISSYTQAFNKVEKRHGPLLESPFKRIKIDNENYLQNLLIYIHQNPLELGVAIDGYAYSSYNELIADAPTDLQREEVISLFGDVENFTFCHKRIVESAF